MKQIINTISFLLFDPKTGPNKGRRGERLWWWWCHMFPSYFIVVWLIFALRIFMTWGGESEERACEREKHPNIYLPLIVYSETWIGLKLMTHPFWEREAFSGSNFIPPDVVYNRIIGFFSSSSSLVDIITTVISQPSEVNHFFSGGVSHWMDFFNHNASPFWGYSTPLFPGDRWEIIDMMMTQSIVSWGWSSSSTLFASAVFTPSLSPGYSNS